MWGAHKTESAPAPSPPTLLAATLIITALSVTVAIEAWLNRPSARPSRDFYVLSALLLLTEAAFLPVSIYLYGKAWSAPLAIYLLARAAALIYIACSTAEPMPFVWALLIASPLWIALGALSRSLLAAICVYRKTHSGPRAGPPDEPPRAPHGAPARFRDSKNPQRRAPV